MARILIVDDEHGIALMLKSIFAKDGHDVTTAFDGREALAALGIEPPDAGKTPPSLAILDVMMPGIDGLEVSARMFADPRTKDVPVILLTAQSGMNERAVQAPNIADRVAKPFDPRDIRELVAGILELTK
jgi:CheY-like chemotaxis protein